MMTGRRWAISPRDKHAHLLLAEQLVAGILRTRCSAILPPFTAQFDAQPPSAVCAMCFIVAKTSGE